MVQLAKGGIESTVKGLVDTAITIWGHNYKYVQVKSTVDTAIII